MAFPKGKPNPNAGRRIGSPNASTLDARRAIADFVEGNVERLNGWLDQIAETNPLAAFDRFMSVVEYHVPRLQRQEITGKDGAQLQINVVTGVQAVEAEFSVVSSGGGSVDACAVDAVHIEDMRGDGGLSVPDAILRSDVVADDAVEYDRSRAADNKQAATGTKRPNQRMAAKAARENSDIIDSKINE